MLIRASALLAKRWGRRRTWSKLAPVGLGEYE